MAYKLTADETRGIQKILVWGFSNFHKLKEDNKVRMWLKIYDKIEPDKLEVSGKLADEVAKARQRAQAEIF